MGIKKFASLWKTPYLFLNLNCLIWHGLTTYDFKCTQIFLSLFLSETGASTYKLYKALDFKDVKKGEWVMVMNKNEKFLGKVLD